MFSGVSLVVGGFLIFNTFSITIAQRIREFGLLRTLGASRGQVLPRCCSRRSSSEASGAVLGLAGGLAFASGINGLFKAFGIDLPNTGTVLAPRTVIVALVIGLAITMLAALTPALRATRVSPMAALREAELPESHGAAGRIVAVAAALLAWAGS